MLPLFLFAGYVLSMIASGNFDYQLLEHKLSLVIFPLIFYLHTYSSREREQMMRVFVFSLLISGVICVLMAAYRSVHWNEGQLIFNTAILPGKSFSESILYGGNQFFGKYLSIFHQTVYFSLYLCVGVIIILFQTQLFKAKIRVWALLVFVILLFLISNKAGLLSLGIIFFYRLLTLPFSRNRKIVYSGLLILMTLIFLNINPRFHESFLRVIKGDIELDTEGRYGFSPRLLSWDAALELIREKPLMGYGAGQAQLVLNETYEKKGYIFPLKESLNAHNQFLQIWIENGLLGLLSFILILVILIIKTGNYKGEVAKSVLIFVIVISVNAMFESVLNRFSGISFFAFTTCFIISQLKGRIH